MKTTIELALTPRDGLFCKDGRGWFSDALGQGHALDWPHPSTLLGALRSTWGRARERREATRFVAEQWREQTADLRLGPTLALRRPWDAPWSVAHRLWPAPADAWLCSASTVSRLAPVPEADGVTTIGRGESSAVERLWRAKSRRAKSLAGPSWWSEASFIRWLTGVDVLPELEGAEMTRRLVTHVAMSRRTGTALDENLYSHDVVETLEPGHQWAVGAQLEVGEDVGARLATLGSDRRLAPLERLRPEIFGLPETLRRGFAGGSRGLRLYVATPAVFAAGWLPDGFDESGSELRGRLPGIDAELILRAAFIGRPLAISGWDMAANRPKPSVRAVPPGSVYALVRADGAPFTASELEASWLASIGARTHEGFGRVVPGCWHPPDPSPRAN